MKAEKMCEVTEEAHSQKHKGQMKMWTEYESWYAQIKDRVLDY
jgi:hypothetical protein